jgi:hypothetical protein
MLALAPHAEGEIVYTTTTNSCDRCSVYSIFFTLAGYGSGTYDYYYDRSASTTWVRMNGAPGNSFMTIGSFAAALGRGAQIGPSDKFISGSALLAHGFRCCTTRTSFWRCDVPFKGGGYLGLKFTISGQVHYGWARIEETCHKGFVTVSVTGTAYETIPNKGLAAGQQKDQVKDESLTEPGVRPLSDKVQGATTLGMLAQGAHALSQWRAPQSNAVGDSKYFSTF